MLISSCDCLNFDEKCKIYLTDHLQVANDVDDCLAWVQQAELVFSSDLTSISDEDAMMEAFGRHEQVYKEMDRRKSRIEAVLKRGKSMLSAIPSAEKSSFSARLDVLFRRWSSLSERASHKESHFDSFVSSQEDFYENLEGFVEWMRRMGMVVSQDIDEFVGKSKYIEALLTHQGFCEDIKHHERIYEMLIKNGEKILEGLPIERKKSFHEQLLKLKEGWENLVDVATDKEEDLVGLSGVASARFVLSRSNSKKTVPHIADEEEEELTKKLNVIESRLEELRTKVRVAGENTDEKMESHLAVCLQSDAEMEKIDDVIGKVSRLPIGSDERRAINVHIENVKRQWDEIAEALHRERSDLEKEIEVEGKLDSLNREFDEIDRSIDLSRPMLMEDLECGLEKMIGFIDENSDIEDKIMKLPDKSGVSVKMKMLSVVKEMFDQVDEKKNHIRVEIEKLKEREVLIAEIDHLTLQVAMLNQPWSPQEDENGDEDELAALSHSVKLCLDLTEKALLLKPRVMENSGERGMKLYEEKLTEIEDVLRREKEKKEKAFADFKTSKELIDALATEVANLKIEDKMAALVKIVSSTTTTSDLESVKETAYHTVKELETLKKKSCDIENCFPEQNVTGIAELMVILGEHELQFQAIIESVEQFQLFSEHAYSIAGKFETLRNDLISSSSDITDAREKLHVFTHVKREIVEDIVSLQSTVQEIKVMESKVATSELKAVLQKKLDYITDNLDNTLLELNIMGMNLQVESKCRSILEGLDRLSFDSSLSLEDSREYSERYLEKVGKYESDLFQMEKEIEGEEQRESIAEVSEKCRKTKDLLQNRMVEINEVIPLKSLFYDGIQKCEKFIASFYYGKIKGGNVTEVKQKILDARKVLESNLKDTNREEVMHRVSSLSCKDFEDMIEKQRKIAEESDRALKQVDEQERSVDEYMRISDLIRDEFQNLMMKKLNEFSSMVEVEETLEELKSKEELMKSEIDSLGESLDAIKDLIEDAEIQNISKQMSDYEKGLENLLNAVARMEEDLVNGKSEIHEFEVCNDELCRNLEKGREQFDLDMKISLTFEAIYSIFDPFLLSISAAEFQLGSLSEKVYALCLPLKEKDRLLSTIDDSERKISSAKLYVESWKGKVDHWNKSIKEGIIAVNNIELWIENLERCLHPKVTENFEAEMKDLGEIEKEMDGIGKQVSQICKITVDAGRAEFIYFSSILNVYL